MCSDPSASSPSTAARGGAQPGRARASPNRTWSDSQVEHLGDELALFLQRGEHTTLLATRVRNQLTAEPRSASPTPGPVARNQQPTDLAGQVEHLEVLVAPGSRRKVAGIAPTVQAE
jgi:hypothetical protein